jgi:adenine-specific DNA-methyltransferase
MTEATTAIARSGESARQRYWKDELLAAGIRGKGGRTYQFAELETLVGTRHLHAVGTLKDTSERVAVSFGPEFAPLEQRQVALALDEAEKLRPAPKFIVFAAFSFDPEAAKDIDETNWLGVAVLRAQMNADLLTEDLKKKRASNESFWLIGQPEITINKAAADEWRVEVHGFDYFDMAKGEIRSGSKSNIAVWLLDTDYNGRSLYPTQVFFPMAGEKDGWSRLARNLRAVLNEFRLQAYHGTVSLPFKTGKYRRIAVKIVDDRGIESLVVRELQE